MEGKCLCGTELRKILSWFGIASDECGACESHAEQMDEWTCEQAEDRVELVLIWLRNEAINRRLPFIEPVARAAVLLAIANARKAASHA